jgi:hypothetical protein
MTFLHFEAPKFCIWISFYNFHTNLHTPTFLENNKKKSWGTLFNLQHFEGGGAC